jgi:hypothetical protein
LSSSPIAVTQFAASASGFTAQFNQSVDSSVLNLYDTESGSFGPADVTVVGANQGNVSGSLVVDGNQLTFVKTGGILAPDVYTVTMRSAADGIKGADGSLLDGNSDGTSGDNYVNAFTVEQSSPVVISVADFARGPAQFVNPGVGLPVTLSDGNNVNEVEFSLIYDPALLNITDVQLGSNLPDGAQLESDLTQRGVVAIHIAAPSSMTEGPIDLISLIAQVPDNAVYARAGLIEINQVMVNKGAISSVGDDGVQAVAYLGDTTGNQRYSALDGSRTLRVVSGLDSGFAAYPTIDPTIIADITGNNLLSSLDATRILQEVVGLDRAEIPDIVPVILAGLLNDTGISNTDGITSDPSVSGTVSDDGTITSFRVGLDDMLPSDYVDQTANLQGTSFVFVRQTLEQILGGPLIDGIHTVHFQATDNAGIGPFISGDASIPIFDPSAESSIVDPGAPIPAFDPDAPSPAFDSSGAIPEFNSEVPSPSVDESVSANTSHVDLTFTLDTSSTTIAAVGLSAGSYIGISGNNVTTAAQGLLTETPESGENLTLNASNVLAAGVFQIPNIALPGGDNAFTPMASDRARQTPPLDLSTIQQGTISTDGVLHRNQMALEGIRLKLMNPPLATRALAMGSLAKDDTMGGMPADLLYETVTGSVSFDTRLGEATYALLPSQRSSSDTTLTGLLTTIADGPAKINSLLLGTSISIGFSDLGRWRLRAPLFDVASEPEWVHVTPFALSLGDELLPDVPPALHSAKHAQSMNEFELLGSSTSSARTTVPQIAYFRTDGKDSYTSVGHWDLIAQQIALSNSKVRLIAELSVAMDDYGIAVWDFKYTYAMWRPIVVRDNADELAGGHRFNTGTIQILAGILVKGVVVP